MTKQKIALNTQRRPNRGRAVESGIEEYDRLTHEPWLVKMIDDIRGGNEALKNELPFRCAHYSQFAGNHRTQKDAVAESFTFQTTVDIDDKPLVEDAIRKAQELDKDETSMWHGMLRHIEYSARGKAHIDILMPAGMTIAETQQMYCEALGVPYDESCISAERILYVTDYRQEVYRHDEWYKVFEGEELAARQKAFTERGLTIDGRATQGAVIKAYTRKCGESSAAGHPQPTLQATLDPDAEENVEKATAQSLMAFDLCVKEAGLNVETMDVWGEHNWHRNLMAVLSVGLPKLMSKEQLVAVVRERLENYGRTDDCQKLIEYFYENYSADVGFMSQTLRGINARSQVSIPCIEDNADTEEDEKVLEDITKGWEPPKMPKRLPRLVELEVKNFDRRYRESLALTAAVGHAGIASHYRGKYLNNKVVTPATMISVIGGSGSGKDNCTQLFNQQMKLTIDKTDSQEWDKVRANAELREKMKNAKECPPKYHPKLRLFETASKTSLLELQTNLGENGMLVGLFSEADGFVGSSQTAWSNISVLLRKGWGGEKHRQFYVSESSCNTNTQLNISLLMEGTPKAMLVRMFNDKNCENGTMQRFIPVLMPKTKRTFRPPMQDFLTDDERMERDGLLVELYRKDQALGDETLLLDTPKTNNAIGAWFDSLEERYNDGELTEAEADLSHRCGEFMLRAAIPLVALYGETKEVVDYAVWVGEMAFYNMCRVFGQRVQTDINASNELLASQEDMRKTAEPLLNKMSQIFTTQEFKDMRLSEGQSDDVRMLLSRYCKKGKIKRIDKGVYEKC